jgi:hypothetical protein
MVTNETDEDTTQYTTGLNRWAYSVERGPDNIDNLAQNRGLNAGDLVPLYSTFENIAHMDMDLSREALGIEAENLSRAELKLYEHRELFDETLPANHVRPEHDRVKLLLRDEDLLDESILDERTTQTFTTRIDSSDFIYRYNFTRYINELLYVQDDDPTAGQRYFLAVESNNGILYSTLLYTAQSEENYPKILITSVKSTVTN